MATITLNDISYRILENIRSTPHNDDDVDIRECANWAQNIRGKFIKQKLDKYPLAPIDESYVQDLGAVEIEVIDSSNHPTLKTFRKILRTKLELPLPIETSKGLGAYTRIAPSDKMMQSFKLISYDEAPYVGSGKFNQFECFACQIGGYIYLFSKDPSIYEIKYINVRGVFGNPVEVMLFNDSTLTTDECYAKEYPINVSMAEDVIAEATNLWYRFNVAPPKDNIENEANELVNAPVKK